MGTIVADEKDIKAGATLYMYKVSKSGEMIMVKANTCKVSDKENVSVKLPESGTYELVTSKEAKVLDKQILNSLKPKKEQASVKKGKSTEMEFADKFNEENAKKIVYSVSNAAIAKISKYGKITAKKAGTVQVTATITLINGKKKTVRMTVKVK